MVVSICNEKVSLIKIGEGWGEGLGLGSFVYRRLVFYFIYSFFIRIEAELEQNWVGLGLRYRV